MDLNVLNWAFVLGCELWEDDFSFMLDLVKDYFREHIKKL